MRICDWSSYVCSSVLNEHFALYRFGGTILEGPDAQLRPLQVDEDRRRAAGLLFERSDRGDHLCMTFMVAMAHVDAKGVGARTVQLGNHRGVRACGPEGCQNAHLALAGDKALNHKCPD